MLGSYYIWVDANGKKYRECDLTDDHIKNIVKFAAKTGFSDGLTQMLFEKVLEVAGRRGIDVPDKIFEKYDEACQRREDFEEDMLDMMYPSDD